MTPASPPPSASPRARWDIFCTVIDNFGDIGVSWRLARQLAAEHGVALRLWVDDLGAFAALCPQIDARLDEQTVQSVEVRRWRPGESGESHEMLADFIEAPGDVVVEAFGCNLPEAALAAMARRPSPPVWINLEYLSAEAWTLGCHGLGSPHPRLPLTRHFFFPGFVPESGGLLREGELLARRDAAFAELANNPAARLAFVCAAAGLPAPAAPLPAETLLVSLFAYENPAIGELCALWAAGETQVCCLLPVSRALPAAAAFFGQELAAGDVVRKGMLEVRVLPFVEQPRYDPLLWACDLNFVRGEDSFVRAQWAARPFVWHIYPQEDDAHRVKLDAFLDLHCAGLPPTGAAALREFWHAWNRGHVDRARWQRLLAEMPALARHAVAWSEGLARQADLAQQLVIFSRSRL